MDGCCLAYTVPAWWWETVPLPARRPGTEAPTGPMASKRVVASGHNQRESSPRVLHHQKGHQPPELGIIRKDERLLGGSFLNYRDLERVLDF